MSSGDKQPAGVVMPVALAIREALKPACHKCTLAGSLRRKEPLVGDVEIVLYPLLQVGLCGDTDEYPGLDAAIRDLLAREVIRLDRKRRCDGRKYRRFVITQLADLPLEVYIASRENFGNILAIRTGPAAFSTALVSRDHGFMPAGLSQVDGYLKRADGTVIGCETEAAYFAALGIAPGPPEERGIAEVMRLRRIRSAVGRVE